MKRLKTKSERMGMEGCRVRRRKRSMREIESRKRSQSMIETYLRKPEKITPEREKQASERACDSVYNLLLNLENEVRICHSRLVSSRLFSFDTLHLSIPATDLDHISIVESPEPGS